MPIVFKKFFSFYVEDIKCVAPASAQHASLSCWGQHTREKCLRFFSFYGQGKCVAPASAQHASLSCWGQHTREKCLRFFSFYGQGKCVPPGCHHLHKYTSVLRGTDTDSDRHFRFFFFPVICFVFISFVFFSFPLCPCHRAAPGKPLYGNPMDPSPAGSYLLHLTSYF